MTQSKSLARWAAAVALTMASVFTFYDVVLGAVGVVVLPLAVYAAATGTGWARNDAVAIAASSSFVAIVGVLTFGRFTSFTIIGFGLVTVAVLRPPGRRILGYRLAALLVFFLVAHSGPWWVVILIPALVAATDEVARLTTAAAGELAAGGGSTQQLQPAIAGAGETAASGAAEEEMPAYRGASAALALASLACCFLVAEFMYFPTSGPSGVPPLLVGFAVTVGAVVLSIRALRTDPMRATAALALSSIPLVVLGLFVLIWLGGGISIGD